MYYYETVKVTASSTTLKNGVAMFMLLDLRAAVFTP